MTEPHEYTADEVRDLFLKHVWNLLDYWDNNKSDKREAMEGLAFSMLVMLDGGSVVVPPFAVIPAPHPDDKEFCIGEGTNWFPQFDPGGHCDIAGGLHELFPLAKPGGSKEAA